MAARAEIIPDGSVAPDQAEIVAGLQSGALVGEAGPLKRIDTHMSHVFLGQRHVFKLKRAVRHPFADMRSAAARHSACEAELAVNAAFAPALYEAVLPITRGNGDRMLLNGRGEPLDWVVMTRRFDDGALLSELASNGSLTAGHVAEAVDAISSVHQALSPVLDAGHAVDYRRILDGLRTTEAQAAADLGLLSASHALHAALEKEIARHAKRIERRRNDGWVKRGHGDLHLANICVFEGRVLPFDALEFSPALATGDVLYDFAFLLMDLAARGLGHLANEAMNRYWDNTAQPETALVLLPLFMALRAAVRVAVLVEAGDLASAQTYRALGIELLRNRPPRLVAVGGLSGSGKTTLARRLAGELSGVCGARLLRTDVVRKMAAHAGRLHRLGGDSYRPSARADIYRQLAEQATQALGAGVSVVADGTFREAVARSSIAAAAGDFPFAGLWLAASLPVRLRRIEARKGDESDVTAAIAAGQDDPADLEAAWSLLDADRELEALAGSAHAILERPASTC